MELDNCAVSITQATDTFVKHGGKEEDEEVTSTTEEATSTTEEVASSAESEAAEQADILFEPVTEEEKQEALRQYGQRFGQDRSGKQPFTDRKRFPVNPEQPLAASDTKKVGQVLAQLDRDLAPRPKVAEPPEQARLSGDFAELADSVEEGLRPTFGYAGSLSENAPFAKFDIRDHVCLKVGGFKHGQVVRHRGDGLMVVVGVKPADGTQRLWFHPIDLGRPGAGAYRGISFESMNLRVTPVESSEAHEAPHFYEMKPEDFNGGEDSDGEEVHLCCHCRLPVGSRAYLHGEKKIPVHGECMAELMKNEMKQKEDLQRQKNDELKKKDRDEYDIGWNVSSIPDNMLPAMQLGCSQVPQGMCCLVFDKESHSATLAPTLEPAEGMNLEYLSLALQVRLSEGREPVFSLDPVDPSQKWEKDAMQMKRFEPEWLAGTSVGEVMFQADYHLKELSMGECEQPVVGMKSCFDFTEADGLDKEWNAREWFIVRKAEILVTDDNVLVPRVRMGVEAREMMLEDDELVDMKTTRPNHPMVKFAESFTYNFDLIAERRSVIFHLRELAKASVMAKMLIDGNVNLYGPWLEVAREACETCPMEVPQLWNQREYAKIHVRKGEIMEDGALRQGHHSHGIYGGVNFGLEKAAVSMPNMLSRGRLASAGLKPAASLSAVGISGFSRAGIPTVATSLPQPGVATALSAVAAPAAKPPTSPAFAAALSGVKLLAPKPGQALSAARTAVPLTPGPIGLSAMAPPPGIVGPKAGVFVPGRPPVGLRAEFKPMNLTSPGLAVAPTRMLSITTAAPPMLPSRPVPTTALFSPMDPRGVDLNLDQFSLSEPVRVEGGSWAAAKDVKCAPLGSNFFRSIDGDGSEFLEDDKKLLKAIYNRNLCDRREEGEQFTPPDTSYEYVQRLRALVTKEEDVRTLRQGHFFSSAFSIADPGPYFPTSWKPSVEVQEEVAGKPQRGKLHARPEYKDCSQKFDDALKSTVPIFDRSTEEQVRFRIYHLGNLEVRTTQETDGKEVIGAVFSFGGSEESKKCNPGKAVDDKEKIVKVTEYVDKAEQGRRSYLELLTEQGNKILTEKLADGTTTWVENPADLEDRNSLAKVVRMSDCTPGAVNVRFMKDVQRRENTAHSSRSKAQSSRSKCKQYVQNAYARAVGDFSLQVSGFWKDEDGAKWQLSEKEYGLYASKQLEDSEEHHKKIVVEEPRVEKTQVRHRPGIGDTVQVKAGGRTGTIVADDHSQMPYKVRFNDGQAPQTKWFKDNQVQLASKPEC